MAQFGKIDRAAGWALTPMHCWKHSKECVSPSPPAKTPADKVIQMLIQKGVLSEEVGRALYQQ